MENIISKFIYDEDFQTLNNIHRWSSFRTIVRESVAEHSYWVTFYANVIIEELCTDIERRRANEIKLEVLRIALMHDFDETFTGDVLHTVKYNNFNGHEIKKSLEGYSKHKVSEKFEGNEPYNKMLKKSCLDYDKALYSIVKIADWISIIQFANTEVSLGNKSMEGHIEYGLTSLKQAVANAELLLWNYSVKHTLEFNFHIFSQISNFQLNDERIISIYSK